MHTSSSLQELLNIRGSTDYNNCSLSSLHSGFPKGKHACMQVNLKGQPTKAQMAHQLQKKTFNEKMLTSHLFQLIHLPIWKFVSPLGRFRTTDGASLSRSDNSHFQVVDIF